MLTKVWTYALGGKLGLMICFLKVLFSPTVVAQMSDQELRIMAVLLGSNTSSLPALISLFYYSKYRRETT